jgi:hypothetical protein
MSTEEVLAQPPQGNSRLGTVSGLPGSSPLRCLVHIRQSASMDVAGKG